MGEIYGSALRDPQEYPASNLVVNGIYDEMISSPELLLVERKPAQRGPSDLSLILGHGSLIQFHAILHAASADQW